MDTEEEWVVTVEVEPIPREWVALLRRFRTGVEIPVSWDED